VTSVPVVNIDSDLESDDNSGLHIPDQVVTMPGHSESKPGQQVTLLGRENKPPNRLICNCSLQVTFVVNRKKDVIFWLVLVT